MAKPKTKTPAKPKRIYTAEEKEILALAVQDHGVSWAKKHLNQWREVGIW
jgi:hypothetical protein